jgi:hypothetical protein
MVLYTPSPVVMTLPFQYTTNIKTQFNIFVPSCQVLLQDDLTKILDLGEFYM